VRSRLVHVLRPDARGKQAERADQGRAQRAQRQRAGAGPGGLRRVHLEGGSPPRPTGRRRLADALGSQTPRPVPAMRERTLCPRTKVQRKNATRAKFSARRCAPREAAALTFAALRRFGAPQATRASSADTDFSLARRERNTSVSCASTCRSTQWAPETPSMRWNARAVAPWASSRRDDAPATLHSGRRRPRLGATPATGSPAPITPPPDALAPPGSLARPRSDAGRSRPRRSPRRVPRGPRRAGSRRRR